MSDPDPQVYYQRIVTYSDGQQVLIQDAPGVSVDVQVDDLDVVDEQRLDHVSQEEFAELADKAMTHDIQIDTMGGNVNITPKETSMDSTPETQTETQPDQGASQA